ncbi:MAG TPA: hypothetical protein VEZ59_06390, partial [Sphingopyxis sp.]|nr:hypothetical protein [Sphingopyxis sp.]
THGTWKFQVSNDNGGRVDIGSSFTLGGSTSQVLTQLAANVLGYRYLHLVGVSGTVSGSPFIQEVEFKIAATDSDGKPVVPTGGGARAVLAKTGSSTRAWRNLDLLDGFPTTGLQADWEMITDDGVSVRDRYGNNDITLSAGTNISRRAGFLSTAGGKVQTPSFTSVTTVVALVRLPRYAFGDSARSGFIISLSANGGVGLQEGVAGAGSTIYVGGMQGGVHAPPFDGNAHKGIETGHWRLVFYSPSAAQTGPIGFGGRATMTSSTCAEFDVMRASVFTGSALTDDQRTAIFQSYRRTALKYGVALTVNDCRETADFVADTGESNCDGRADIADLSAADQALRLPDALIMSANRTTFMRSLQELQIGVNEQVTAPTVDFGPAFGLAKACRGDAINRRRRLIIGKCGVGGSRIAPSSVGGTASTTWSPTEILGQGIIWRALEHMYATQAQALARGIGPKFAGLGLATGLNDAVSTAYASSDVVYQGYLQAFYDFWVTYGVAPATGYKAALFRPLTSDPASNPTALANIRSACGLFAAAQSGVTNIDTDAYTKEPDNVHWDAVSMVGSAGPSYKSALAL